MRAQLTKPPLESWLADRLGEGARRNNIGLALVLNGPLDVDALRAAVHASVDRHDVLRTAFLEEGGELRLAPPAADARPDLPVVDLTDRPDDVAPTCARLTAEPLDLADPVGVRTTLLRTGPREHRLVWVVHHARWDPGSTDVLVRELFALYEAELGGAPAELPPRRIRYSDFAAWQRARLTGARLAELRDFWRGLRGAPHCELPVDTPRWRVERGRGAAEAAELDPATSAALRRLCERTDTTTYVLALAAFVALLHRITGETDVVLGTASAGRPGRDLDGVVGCFVNMVALRTDASGDPGFGELLERTRAATAAAFAHHELPFEQVLDLAGGGRGGQRPPLFGIEFTAVAAAGPPRSASSPSGWTSCTTARRSSTSVW
ncbi:condensation domain-containing protein [Actinosynnema sp. CA-248983]